jgi:single-strand DNA-binding protein
VQVATFRVASTPRRYQRRTDSWEDGDTQWYAVNAWRGLAENCDASLRRGDPVVVHGKLTASVWTNKAGLEVTSFEVEAAFVGHDLNRGTSEFRRRKLAAAPDPYEGPVIDAGPDTARDADDAREDAAESAPADAA